MYSGDRNAYINSFNSFPLLIIDDLGVERNSEFAREQVFNIIDSRYRSQLPMIVTTNLTVDELKNPADLARARIYDRVLERCTAIKVNDQNIRKLNMAENLTRAKQLLEGVTAWALEWLATSGASLSEATSSKPASFRCERSMTMPSALHSLTSRLPASVSPGPVSGLDG